MIIRPSPEHAHGHSASSTILLRSLVVDQTSSMWRVLKALPITTHLVCFTRYSSGLGIDIHAPSSIKATIPPLQTFRRTGGRSMSQVIFAATCSEVDITWRRLANRYSVRARSPPFEEARLHSAAASLDLRSDVTSHAASEDQFSPAY